MKAPLDPARNPLKQLADLLRAEHEAGGGDDAEERDDDDDGQAPPPKKSKSKPKKLEQLAEALGLEEADVYAIEVPAKHKGAEALSLGKLKDLAAEHGDLTVLRLQLEQDRRDFEAVKVRKEQEFHTLLEQLPADAIKPEAMQKLRGVLDKRRGEQRALTLELISEWDDETKRTEDLKGMVKHLEDAGVSPAVLVANPDAYLVRFVRNSWKNSEMIRKALEGVTERKPRTPGRARTEAGDRPAGKRTNGPLSRTQRQVSGFMDTISNHGKR